MKKEGLEELEEAPREAKERIITFRVDEKTFLSIETVAEGRGKKTNEWARELVVSEAAKVVPMTAGERALFEEMARLRFICGNGFKMLAGGKLSSERWREVLGEAEKNAAEIAEQLLDRRWSSEPESVQREENYAEPEPVR